VDSINQQTYYLISNISNNPQDHTVRNRQKKNDQIITDYKDPINWKVAYYVL
jgi:hypothetical protein